MSAPVPIFILTFNRLTVLTKAIQSYDIVLNTAKNGGEYEIVIIDTGTTFDPTLNFLSMLEADGITVFKGEPINKKNDFDSLSVYIQDYMQNKNYTHYIVTDCDIELLPGSHRMLTVYRKILDALPDIDVIAPSLILDDIPSHYPNRARVRRKHKIYWPDERQSITLPRTAGMRTPETIEYIKTEVATTFGMYRTGFKFVRHKRNAIRTFQPYVARHLDWYNDPRKMNDDQIYYERICTRDVNHWRVRR